MVRLVMHFLLMNFKQRLWSSQSLTHTHAHSAVILSGHDTNVQVTVLILNWCLTYDTWDT